MGFLGSSLGGCGGSGNYQGHMCSPVSSDNSRIIDVEGRIKFIYSTVDLVELLLEGKDIVEYRKTYLEQIMKLPFVCGNQLKATEVFHRIRKLQEFLEAE